MLQREPQYNIAPTEQAPVIAAGENGLEMKALRWGLVPSWATVLQIGARAINARVETAATKPMFRAAMKKRRCLIPAAGYFEWRKENGAKQPYFLHAPDNAVLLFAGLWEAWRPKGDDEADSVRTFTILTGAPGKVSADIHDRQPVILPADRWEQWLGPDENGAAAVLADVPEADLTYYAVTKEVNSPRNHGPEMIEPLEA